MHRYFLEVAYKGTAYSGFQVQENANTIQAETENALRTILRENIVLTGSSRTDAGVHALQNFFHFDTAIEVTEKNLYNLNALLPPDIVANGIYPVPADAHCRFDAVSREYKYYIYNRKNPFLRDTAYYFPYRLDFDLLQEGAMLLKKQTDFTTFSKRKTQVKTFLCNIEVSRWSVEHEQYVFTVVANRFLRGMVRGLVGTMLKIARGAMTLAELSEALERKDCRYADFSAPAHGLFLVNVKFKDGLLQQQGQIAPGQPT